MDVTKQYANKAVSTPSISICLYFIISGQKKYDALMESYLKKKGRHLSILSVVHCRNINDVAMCCDKACIVSFVCSSKIIARPFNLLHPL